jgi:hypothetical protein
MHLETSSAPVVSLSTLDLGIHHGDGAGDPLNCTPLIRELTEETYLKKQKLTNNESNYELYMSRQSSHHCQIPVLGLNTASGNAVFPLLFFQEALS